MSNGALRSQLQSRQAPSPPPLVALHGHAALAPGEWLEASQATLPLEASQDAAEEQATHAAGQMHHAPDILSLIGAAHSDTEQAAAVRRFSPAGELHPDSQAAQHRAELLSFERSAEAYELTQATQAIISSQADEEEESELSPQHKRRRLSSPIPSAATAASADPTALHDFLSQPDPLPMSAADAAAPPFEASLAIPPAASTSQFGAIPQQTAHVQAADLPLPAPFAWLNPELLRQAMESQPIASSLALLPVAPSSSFRAQPDLATSATNASAFPPLAPNIAAAAAASAAFLAAQHPAFRSLAAAASPAPSSSSPLAAASSSFASASPNVSSAAIAPGGAAGRISGIVGISGRRARVRVCHVDACGHVSESDQDRVDHMRTQHQVWFCLSCDAEYANEADLKQHLPSHSQGRPYVCELCGRGFVESRDLNRHRPNHSGARPFVCQTCNRGFSRLHALQMHQKIHARQKEFVCGFEGCGKAFVQKAAMQSHERTHTGDRPFVCEICSKSFMQRTALVTHQRLHTGEKPYQCQHCPRRFVSASNLIVHERTHTGESFYRCRQCAQSFTRRAALNKHLLWHIDPNMVSVEQTLRDRGQLPPKKKTKQQMRQEQMEREADMYDEDDHEDNEEEPEGDEEKQPERAAPRRRVAQHEPQPEIVAARPLAANLGAAIPAHLPAPASLSPSFASVLSATRPFPAFAYSTPQQLQQWQQPRPHPVQARALSSFTQPAAAAAASAPSQPAPVAAAAAVLLPPPAQASPSHRRERSAQQQQLQHLLSQLHPSHSFMQFDQLEPLPEHDESDSEAQPSPELSTLFEDA